MNFELFIAKRIHFSKGKGEDKRVTPPVVRIAIAGVAIGLAVMILSVAIVISFKKEVRNKIIGFDSHIQLTNFDSNSSFESVPIVLSDSLRDVLTNTDGVKHIESFATRQGIIKTGTDFHGIVLRGVDFDFDTTFIGAHLVEGQIPKIDPEISSSKALISKKLSGMLRLANDDSFISYFVNNEGDIRAVRLSVSGIYDTGFPNYDNILVICDIKQIRRINGWDEDMVSGVGIYLDDYNRLDELKDDFYFSLIENKDRLGNIYYIRSIKELNPELFDWLDFLDSNVAIILTLMIIVSGCTMISGLLIIILERTNMIGILKTLGQNNYSLRNVFLHISFLLILKGMFWGNVTGLLLCFIQSHFQLFKLDRNTYYLDAVPIEINWVYLALINIGALTISMFMMLAPSYLISKIEPAKSVRFE